MNKIVLDRMWDQFRQKYGVYLRLLEAFPADKLATHPVAGMRTPAELVAHVCGTIVRDIPEGVAKGRITAEESEEAKTAGELSDTAALLAFARRCWEQGDARRPADRGRRAGGDGRDAVGLELAGPGRVPRHQRRVHAPSGAALRNGPGVRGGAAVPVGAYGEKRRSPAA